jgi:hypothetical protein
VCVLINTIQYIHMYVSYIKFIDIHIRHRQAERFCMSLYARVCDNVRLFACVCVLAECAHYLCERVRLTHTCLYARDMFVQV